MDRDKSTNPKNAAEKPDEKFVRRLNYETLRAMPTSDAIATALHAIQQLDLQVSSQEAAAASVEETHASATAICSSCGSKNPAQHKFCSICGAPSSPASTQLATPARALEPNHSASPAGQHHYHHHYHHHYFAGDAVPATQLSSAEPVGAISRDAGRPRAPLSGAAPSRAEAAVRQLAQDWAQACNTKHLDDLVELYGADALIMRPNVPPVRGVAAVREFFFSLLEAGLGDVEMDTVRTEIFGDVAYEAGRCKMLVPTAAGKRREERGKYLIVAARANGEWKIVSDSWSSDLSLAAADVAMAAPAAAIPLLRPARKT